MRITLECLLGGLLFAATLYVPLTVPTLLLDQDATSEPHVTEARR